MAKCPAVTLSALFTAIALYALSHAEPLTGRTISVFSDNTIHFTPADSGQFDTDSASRHCTDGTDAVENVRPKDTIGRYGYWRLSGQLLGRIKPR